MQVGLLTRRFDHLQENCTKWNASGSNGTTFCGGRTKGEWSLDATNDSGDGDVEAVRPWQVVFFGILAAYTSLLTVVGNVIVLLSFILERSIRQTSNYFIASLAVSDLLIGCVSMPLYTVYMLSGPHWPLGEVLCDLWLSLDYTVCLCSIYTVFCITIDRYCSVTIPAKYHKWRTERKVITMVAITWIVPVIVFFTSIIGWQYFVHQRTVPSGKCYVQYMENALFNCLLQVGYFWLTLFIMCGLYAGIYRVALRLHRKSETRRKKMTSLVSMAGQTITKIGIGVTGQQKKQDAAAAAAAATEAATIGMQMLQVSKGPSKDSCREVSTTRSLGLFDGQFHGVAAKDDLSRVKGHVLPESFVLENHFGEDLKPGRVETSTDDVDGSKEIKKMSTSVLPKSSVKNSSLADHVQPTMTRQSSPGHRRIRISLNEIQTDAEDTRIHQIGASFGKPPLRKTCGSALGLTVHLDDGIVKSVDHQDHESGQKDGGSCGPRVVRKTRLRERNWSWAEDDRTVSRGSAVPFLMDEVTGNAKSAEKLLRGEEASEDDCLTLMANRLHRPLSACTIGDRRCKAYKSVEDRSSTAEETSGEHRRQEEQTATLLDDALPKRRKGKATMCCSLPSDMIPLSGATLTAAVNITPKSNQDNQKFMRYDSSDATPHCDPLSDIDGAGIDRRKTTPTTPTTTTTTTTTTTATEECGSVPASSTPPPQDTSLFFTNYPAQTSCESDCPEQTCLLAPPFSSTTGPSSCDATSFCSAVGVTSLLPDRDRRRKSRFIASRKWSSRRRAEKRRELGRYRGGGGGGDGDGTTAEETDERTQQHLQSRQKHENRAKKSLRTITLILGAFVVCWTPWHILSLIIGFCPGSAVCVPPILYDISYWLCYINSPLNPFCYAFANQQFKKTFVRILRLDWHKT